MPGVSVPVFYEEVGPDGTVINLPAYRGDTSGEVAGYDRQEDKFYHADLGLIDLNPQSED